MNKVKKKLEVQLVFLIVMMTKKWQILSLIFVKLENGTRNGIKWIQ